MIGLPANTPVYLCTDPVDFRKGFDGLTGIVTATLGHSVTDGSLFLFVNRSKRPREPLLARRVGWWVSTHSAWRFSWLACQTLLLLSGGHD